MVSCGAGDGTIKVWDLRRNYSCYKKEPLPKNSLPYPGTSTLQGYTNLLFDPSRQRLYVNCMDHNIYCFNLGVYATQPIISYTGLTNSTFYIKSCLSPDGKYLISGSSDEKAYIWNIEHHLPIVSLTGHAREVTCVAWARTNDHRIVTCSDDARHKIWRINYDNLDEDGSMNYRGKSEVLNRKLTPKRRFRALQDTPRTVKRLKETNETTPCSTEKNSLKRSYNELCADDSYALNGGDSKRQLIETRARRLFPSTSSSSSRNDCDFRSILTEIPEETETPQKEESEKLLSPLNERNQLNHYRLTEIRTPSSSHRPTCSMALFSPTSNLPNYVIDGDAPHLKLQSPKRKLKENVDWLTKIRKQKLSTTINSVLHDRSVSSVSGSSSNLHSEDLPCTSTSNIGVDSVHDTTTGILSPRVRKIKSTDRTGAYGSIGSSSPSRRLSSCSKHHNSEVKTPTRRNSETTLLKFFCVTPTTRNSNTPSTAQTTEQSNAS